MPLQPRLPREARTPQAQLVEGPAHRIVGYQLAQASIVTSKVFEQVAAQHAADARLRPVEFTLLALVLDNPDVTARQLSRALAITPPNLVGRLEQMQSRGFIDRKRSEHDGRAQSIRLTPAGRKLVQRYAGLLDEGEQAALAALSAGERAILIELLHKVALGRR